MSGVRTSDVSEEMPNMDRVEDECGRLVAADELYWRENDAKFRAVHQRVQTYEEFRFASHIPTDSSLYASTC